MFSEKAMLGAFLLSQTGMLAWGGIEAFSANARAQEAAEAAPAQPAMTVATPVGPVNMKPGDFSWPIACALVAYWTINAAKEGGAQAARLAEKWLDKTNGAVPVRLVITHRNQGDPDHSGIFARPQPDEG
jgi:hypothetical protein